MLTTSPFIMFTNHCINGSTILLYMILNGKGSFNWLWCGGGPLSNPLILLCFCVIVERVQLRALLLLLDTIHTSTYPVLLLMCPCRASCSLLQGLGRCTGELHQANSGCFGRGAATASFGLGNSFSGG